MLRPRRQGAKRSVGSRLVAGQAALFDKVVAELAKSESIGVIVEARPGEHPKPDKAEARCIAVAVLEAKTHHAENHQGG